MKVLGRTMMNCLTSSARALACVRKEEDIKREFEMLSEVI